MKLERWLPLALLPNVAMAGGGGGGLLLGVLIFLPLLIWAFIRIWKFWLRLIFGGLAGQAPQTQHPQHPQVTQANSPVKECPFCAETIHLKAVKCKHCGSAL